MSENAGYPRANGGAAPRSGRAGEFMLVASTQDNQQVIAVVHKRFHIETYGCQMNLSDSELMAGILTSYGYRAADNLEDADIIIVNTCAVREHAEKRVIGHLANLNRYKQKNPNLVLGVCGCMAQHMKEKIIEAAPHVDFVIGPDAYRNLPVAISSALEGDAFLDLKLDKTEVYSEIEPSREAGVRAWLTIMRGCNKMCTFCIVPYVRGRERSIPMAALLAEVRKLAQDGFAEVVLLGQTVNSYHDGQYDFGDLLIAINGIEGIERIRFISPHPVDITDKMIDVMARYDKICKHIHLPLQSGSTKILQTMRRNYTAEEYLRLVEKMREKMPTLAIGTDIIAGFCGETEEDFQATYHLVETVRFDSAFMFKYSPRQGTIAYRKLADDVPPEEKGRRLTAIIELQERISLEINKGLIGQEVEVLVEGESKRDPEQLCGKTDSFKTTVFPRDNAKAGQFVKIKIANATGHTLSGEIL